MIKVCRQLNLSDAIVDIRAKPEVYLKKIANPPREICPGLRAELVKNLAVELKVPKTALSARYISNLSASQLLQHGFTLLAVAEIQEWLLGKKLSLTRRAPENGAELAYVKRAVYLLDAFNFDAAHLRAQLDTLTHEQRPGHEAQG